MHTYGTSNVVPNEKEKSPKLSFYVFWQYSAISRRCEKAFEAEREKVLKYTHLQKGYQSRRSMLARQNFRRLTKKCCSQVRPKILLHAPGPGSRIHTHIPCNLKEGGGMNGQQVNKRTSAQIFCNQNKSNKVKKSSF